MKAYCGSGGIDLRILDLGNRWKWVVSFRLRPFYPQGKSPWYPLDKRIGGPQSQSGRGSEEKNSQPLPGLEPPIILLVAQRYTTELSWQKQNQNKYKRIPRYGRPISVTARTVLENCARGIQLCPRFHLLCHPAVSHSPIQDALPNVKRTLFIN
jgi:hypothetical protein